jgi:hypothetical protein
LRFDRQLETFQPFPRPAGVGREFVSVGDRLLLATEDGISVFHDNSLEEYFVDRTTDGRLRIAVLDR